MAAKGVNLINEFLLLNAALMYLTKKKKHKQRQERLIPALGVIFTWLETVNASLGTMLLKAVSHVLNGKKRLYRFFESPYVSKDNTKPKMLSSSLLLEGRLIVLQHAKQNGARASHSLC